MPSLELVLEKLEQKVDGLSNDLPKFSEGIKAEPEFNEGDSYKALGLMAIGGAVAPLISTKIATAVPSVASFSKAIPVGVGLTIRMFAKGNNTMRNIGDGMIISGLSAMVSSLLGGGSLFGEAYSFPAQQKAQQAPMFGENRIGGVNFG